MQCTEVSATKGNRPEKRKGGGGYGYYKNMNNSSDNRDRKTNVYRQPKRKRSGPDARQFSR